MKYRPKNWEEIKKNIRGIALQHSVGITSIPLEDNYIEAAADAILESLKKGNCQYIENNKKYGITFHLPPEIKGTLVFMPEED